MRKPTYNFILILISSVYLFSCDTSDVPISNNIKLPDSRLVGFWVGSSMGIEVRAAPGGGATFVFHKYDEKEKKISSYAGSQLYFKDFPEAKMVSGSNGKEFTTIKYKFIQNNQLIISRLVYSSVKGDYTLDRGSEYHYLFRTVSNFQKYVAANILRSGLYAPDETYKKVSGLNILKASLARETDEIAVQESSGRETPLPEYTSKYPDMTSNLSENRERNLELTYKYSYLDVYQIQKTYPKSSCLSFSVEAGEEYGETKTIYERKPLVVYDSQGNPTVTDDFPTKREVFISHGTSSQNVIKNTCPYFAYLKGILKTKDENGQIVYQDATYRFSPNETLKDNIHIVDSYNPATAENGFIYYKNDLKIDPEFYRSYLREVLNNPRGSIIVNSYSSRSRIYLYKGDKISLRADGTVRVGIFAGNSKPDGIDGYDSYSTTKNAKHGSLIYKIGDEEEWGYVGENATIIAQKSGILKLTVNDESTYDNMGQYLVDYEITRARK